MQFIVVGIALTLLSFPIAGYSQEANPLPVPPASLNKEELDDSLNDFGTKILNYFSTQKQIDNRGNALLIFQESPGGDNNQASAALSAKKTRFGNFNLVDPVLVEIINRTLYGDPDISDVYANFFDQHAGFCSWQSSYEVDKLNCRDLGNQPERAFFQHADIKASILMNEVELDSPVKQTLAKQYIVNATGPFVSDQMKEVLDSSPLDNQQTLQKYVELLAETAGITASQNALVDIYASRIPIIEQNDQGQSVNTGSLMKVMEDEARRRFTNPEWVKSVSVSSQEALLREIAHIEAARLWVDYQNYRLLENLVAITAIQSTNMIKLYNKINSLNIPDLSEFRDATNRTKIYDQDQ